MNISVEASGFQDHFNVSRETLDRLLVYEQLLKKWNPAINLVANSTLEQIWSRHFLESAQLFKYANPIEGLWLDLGSGGGFPGAVAAILAAEMAPTVDFTCIESDIRKCEFLRTVARSTGVKIAVLSRRIEESPPQKAQIVSARALSALGTLLKYTTRHLDATGTAVFLKGESWSEEVTDARQNWSFEMETQTSLTNPGSALLKLRNIVHV